VIFTWWGYAGPCSVFGSPDLNGIRRFIASGAPVKTIPPQIQHPTTILKIAPQTIPHGGAGVFGMVTRYHHAIGLKRLGTHSVQVVIGNYIERLPLGSQPFQQPTIGH
jgi:hypothetical protein